MKSPRVQIDSDGGRDDERSHAQLAALSRASVSRIRSVAFITSNAASLLIFRGPLIETLCANGVVVHALAPDFDERTSSRLKSIGARPQSFSLSRTGLNPLRDLADLLRLVRLLRRLRPDAVICYFIKPVIYGSFAAKLASVSRRIAMIEGLGFAFMDDAGRDRSLNRRLIRLLATALYGFALRFYHKVFFLNPDDHGQFLRERLITSDRAALIDGIGLDLQYFARVALPTAQTPVTFLLVARLLREKGIYEFVEAARIIRKTHADARFVIVGGTDANPACIPEEEVRAWQGEGLVEWPGRVDDVRPWIAAAHVFVLPSYREGLPRSTQEAMSMGRPVVTTDVPGCRHTVIDGVNGFLVPVADPLALARAMERFVAEPALVASMGAAGRRMAEERFDVHKINRQILSILLAP